MNINITKLLSNFVDTIEISSEFTIPEYLIKNTRIKELLDTKFVGDITENETGEIVLSGIITGKMILLDDVTLNDVEYPFNINIEEILEKKQNILDITDILWQNILVEIPSKVRSTDEFVGLVGDGWRLISEDQFNSERNKINNPFANLEELLNTKEDR